MGVHSYRRFRKYYSDLIVHVENISPSKPLFIRPPIRPSTHPSIYPSIRSSVYLSICPSVHPSASVHP